MHGGRLQCTCSSCLVLLLGLFSWALGSSVEQRELQAEICGEILCSFQHLEVDTGNDKLYVGAVNIIYQLDKDLNVEQKAKTGPVFDSEKCHARPPPECTFTKIETNNLNKLLKIDSNGNRIVACGSVKQGICDLRSLGNVSHVLNDFSKKSVDGRGNDFVASTNPDQTTVAFIAEEGYNAQQKSLFVGSSRTKEDVHIITDQDQFPTFSSRRMPVNNMDNSMLAADSEENEASGLVTSKDLATQGFRVNFISAFEGTGNGYFVSSYPEIQYDRVYMDRIKSYVAQVCMRTNDGKSTTNSYFEIPISSSSWLGGRETNLNRVIASATGKVGTLLSNSLHLPSPPKTGNPDVLFASFATEGEHAGGSILAMFPMYKLDDRYYTIAQSCLNGYDMNHIKWNRESELPCKRIEFPIAKPLCSNKMWDVVGLLQSNVSERGFTVFESNDTVVTSVAVIEQGEHTVVFMGTKNGHLLKLKVDSKPSGNRLLQPYEDIEIDSHTNNYAWKNLGSPKILPDMRVDNTKTRLYVMSERKLVSLPLHDCSKFKSCYDCLNAGDPFCGWCTLDNRCTASSQCRKGQHSYQTSYPSNCPKMGDVHPPALAVKGRQVEIEVDIFNIPNRRGQGIYRCVYGDTKTETDAVYQTTQISCMSPPREKVPVLHGQEVSVPLSLYFVRSGQPPVNIASTEIVFYDCSNFKSCLACLSSPEFRCHWCSNDNECLQNDDPCKTYQGNLDDSKRCPRLLRVVEPSHIPFNKKKSVKLRIQNLNAIIESQTRFSCRFSIDGMKPQTVNATQKPSESAILCASQQGFLPADAYEAKARVDVFWKKNFLIDNPDSLNVTMYRCSHGSSDNCGKCLQLSKDLACGWCERDQKCSLCDDCAEKCTNDTSGLYKGWLDEASICMHPEITDFNPKSAAPGGSTKIRIEGINFGKIYKDGKSQLEISVANKTCTVLPEDFKESEKVICKVEGVMTKIEGPVKLCILDYTGKCKGSKYKDSSSKMFEFVEPVLSKFEPKQGLDTGGTVITFTGQHFNIGNSVTVRIGSRQCSVIGGLTSQSFKCKLACDNAARRRRRHLGLHGHLHHHSRHHSFHHRRNGHRLHRKRRAVTSERVKLNFDQKQSVYPDVFLLEDDIPRGEDVKLNRRESIKSGGMKLTLMGKNLHLTQNLVLEVSFEGHSAEKLCEPPGSNKNVRVCYSPEITGYPTGNYSAILKLDDCLNIGIGKIRYTDDPWLEMFPGDSNTYLHQSGPIIISGRNLCPDPMNCDESSAKVMIGDEMKCNVSDLDKDKLVCVPPPDAGGKYDVTVSIGGYTQTVGKLEFESGFPVFVIPVIVICVAFAIIAVVIGLCVHKRANKRVEEVRQKQVQYDLMEAKVAKECKEAFAELQVDMQSDLENMGTVGIPFRQRNDYIMRVLFPEPEMYEKLNNQALSNPYVSDQSRFNLHNGRGAPHRALCAALDDFDKLMENKTFLLLFIYTLENQKRFSMKDRSNVAGLLMIVLQNRLQYATGILEHLLGDLIRDVMESKSNPKLLLRRSESVAEKMLTHWFSILLHGFLQECAGEPLFTLYRAIRAQLDKGPVDVITGFAKYSLNQDKLLRQAISYEHLVLIVRDGEEPKGRELHVKVLDCDTITQTKEKIIALKYRNAPQSTHPSPDAFDLEMNSEVLGQAILSDEDNTSIVEGGWKRLNTLLHYKVKDLTTVTMVPKQDRSRQNPLNQSTNSNYSFGSRIGGMRHNGSGHRLINDGSLPRHVTTVPGSRSSTPTQGDDGKRPYHIMKQHDNEPRDGAGDGSMMVSEIYLTRLLATKGTIQKFVDDMFETIFSVVQRGHALPLAIKHMFDFFDQQAEYFGITDPDVVHTWKSNSLPLRFWVNLIKNPEFLFDIKKTALVDSCLSVIAGTFMDSCSTTDQNLGKDSATGKLLYAKDVQNYKRWVANYYDEISGMDQLNEKDMQIFLQGESRSFNRNTSFSNAALTELYFYVQKYNSEILHVLNDDPSARNQRLAQRLQQVATTMTSTV